MSVTVSQWTGQPMNTFIGHEALLLRMGLKSPDLLQQVTDRWTQTHSFRLRVEPFSMKTCKSI